MDTQALLIEYSKSPPNRGILEHATIHHHETNRVCADVIEVYLIIVDDCLQDFSFDGYMSIVATATTAIVGEAVIGLSVDEILSYDEDFVRSLIGDGISPRRRNASLMGLLAIKNALHTYRADGRREDFLDIQAE